MSTDPHAVASVVQALLVALIRAALTEDAAIVEPWSATSRERHTALRRAVSAAETPPHFNLDGLWVAAMQEAETDRRIRNEANVSLNLPKLSPLTFADLVAADFDIAASIRTIRLSASTG